MLSKPIKDNYTEIKNQVATLIPKILQLKANQIIGVVGATGSGKSYLISAILGAKTTHKKKGGIYEIYHVDNNGKYPQIGNKNTSCTTLPTLYPIGNNCLVDLAGWFDTRPPNQEIINGFSNAALFKYGKRVKIIVVVQISSFQTNRGGSLAEILNRLFEFFEGDLMKMMNSIILVISKVNVSEWDIQVIHDKIDQIKKQNQNLFNECKVLLELLLRNKKVFLFPRPDQLTDHVEKIKKQLNIMPSIMLSHDCRPSLSPTALNLVNDCIGVLNDNISQCTKKITNQINDKYTNLSFKTGQQANTQLCKLRKSERILKREIGKFQTRQNQTRVLNDLKTNLGVSANSSKQIAQNFDMVAFYRQLSGHINFKHNFLDALAWEINQNIQRLERIRQQLALVQERTKMQEKHKAQMKARDEFNQKVMKQNQDKMQKLAKQHNQTIQKQNAQFQKQMKQMSQKHDKNMAKILSQIVASNNKPLQQLQPIFRGSGSSCQIF